MENRPVRGAWRSGLVCGAAAAAVCVGTASASSWTDFNAIIKGNLSSIGDVQGAALVGGNASGNNIFGSIGTTPSNLTLGVGGDVVGNLNLNRGDARIGGTVTSHVNNNGGGSISLGDGTIALLVDAMWSQASSASSAFASLSANSTTSVEPGNKLQFNAAAGAQYAVFDLNASMMSSYQEFLLQRNGAGTIVINVHGGEGSSIDLMAVTNSFTSARDSVVWNFVDADDTINIGRQLEGSVLALGAHLNLSAVIEGTVVAHSAAMNGQEFHLPGFEGDTPTPPPVVPAPSPVLLGLAGLAGVASRRRRAL